MQDNAGLPKSEDSPSPFADVFYIRYLVPLFDPNEKILAELKAKGYTKVNEISFNQIPLWEFKKR